MEFKFRAVDNRPTPTPPPLSTVTYFSHRSLRGGISSMVPSPRPTAFPMPMNNAGEALRRELEKEQIRREIIASEIARRRELEDEVRRELALERGWGLGFSFEERVSMRLNPTLYPFDNNVYGVSQPQLPQLMPASHSKPSPETNKYKVIKLAKPDPSLYHAKRKAVTPPAVDGNSEHFPFGLKKKPKEEWSCALCQVSATSERGLTEHLKGRKHKAKETALRKNKIGKRTNTSLSLKKREKSVNSTEAIVTTTTSGLDAKVDGPSLKPGMTWGNINQTMIDKGAVESKNEEQLVPQGLKNENGTSGQEAVGMNALKERKKMKFWCEICQVGTSSQIVMESHKNGRKHLTRMKKLSQNYGSAPSTSSVSLEVPGLIRDTNAFNTEADQKISHVLSKERIIKMVESFADSDEVSPVAESNEVRVDKVL